MSRRGQASIAGSPVLVGALTTLVVIVAVFLSYNANSGLPFVPTYDIKANVPNAANLVAGNEVNVITVDPDTEHWAKVALQRMLDLPGL